ncbi:hypothetical protein AB5J03_003119 [Yersinia enterocolitica]|nr:hypothetical protein [Yersinia enterocolitica]EKN3994441.1 hypothetical protein [Yersinia enterocolitica]EKN5083414.1 hypothetical protein [Yersinia enterocolitica]EKN6400324.1 hypothetical protein [Yersinia enterocolitica]EKP3833013.1 hypothetical protein [Yersinia enterocolitica]
MHFRFRRSSRAITRPELFRNDKYWVVCWHKGFIPNASLRNQPRVQTEFRPLGKNGELLPIYEDIQLLVQDLSFFSIGSVWHNGVCVQQSHLQEKTFELNFDGGWRFQNAQDASVFPADLYKPDRRHLPESWVIEFDLSNAAKLIVPCIEFFSRCYGFSGEVKRILTTYSWEECQQRLYAPSGMPEEAGKWQICLPPLIPEIDAVMLATAKYQPETQRALSSIHSALSTQFFNQRATGKRNEWPVPLKAGPWHRQPATLVVEGIPYGPDGQSFLGLRITGLSEPDGPPVRISHQQGDKAENPAPPGSDVAFEGARITTRVQVPDSVVVTGFTDPEPGMERTEAETPSLRIVGQRRVINKVISPQARYASGAPVPGKEATSFSPGQAERNERSVGELSVQTRAVSVMDSEGVVRDVWGALLALKDARPDLILSVEWYTPDGGFSDSRSPEYIAFDPGSQAFTELYNWCHTDSFQIFRRGVLFIRIRMHDKTAYIAEIERRPSDSDKDNAKEKDKFQGVIFMQSSPTDLNDWIRSFMKQARLNKGIVGRFIGDMPGIVREYKHPSPTSNSPHPGYPSIRNAFNKIDIKIIM